MAKDIHDLSREDILYARDVDERVTGIRARIFLLLAGGQDDGALDEVAGLSEELRELRDFRAAIGKADSVVRESYWATYAKYRSHDAYGEATETPYWRAKRFARDLQDGLLETSYEEVTLNGVTFLCNGE
jgi:hypothetical protein